MEHVVEQLLVFLTFIGPTLAALIGVFARQVYFPDGFKWRRAMLDVPFAIVVGVGAGALSVYLKLPPPVAYGISIGGGFLGPKFLEGWLKKKANGGTNGGGNETK